ncbi:MAG TPA: hypothetical protein VM364_19840 [Vicinamibacterales bacterium]|nr:hypothetical protein [Vicinamibacterales bacterium]
MSVPLPIVDGLTIGAPHRSLLMPGAVVRDPRGRARRLPRFFYVVDSWQTALATRLAPQFALWEFMDVDLYEPLPLRTFPRYVPCAVSVLAAHLQVLRTEVGQPVKIAANGGYRSPSHGRSRPESTHSWGTAVNIYRIGDEYVDDRETIERYGALAVSLLPAFRARPYGSERGGSDDHLHLDLGYVVSVPAEAPAEEG